MIEYIEGDIFKSPAQVIVNTVNTVGVMGKGLALSFKQRYPDMFEKYRTYCEKHQLTIGKLMLVYEPDHWILLFPTKENWRNPSKIEYLEKGLTKFINSYAEKNITSIAFPRLGCGNGELSWDVVRPVMEKYLKSLPIDIYIYLNNASITIPEHKEQKKTLEWLKENSKDLSFDGMKDDVAYTCSLMYELKINNKFYNVQYKDKLIFIDCEKKEKIIVCENDLYSLWDSIRSKSVFKSSDDFSKENMVYALLNSLGYISEIKILDSKSNMMVNGYQINEGSGRVFSLKENS